MIMRDPMWNLYIGVEIESPDFSRDRLESFDLRVSYFPCIPSVSNFVVLPSMRCEKSKSRVVSCMHD